MTAATQGYMSPSIYDPSNMFAPSGRHVATGNDFLKTVPNGANTTRTIEPQQTNKHIPRPVNVDNMGGDSSTILEFGPSSPYRDQFPAPGSSGTYWSNEPTYHPLSPPDSASFSPKDSWPYTYQNQNPPNLFTSFGTTNLREQYGQITPPDDKGDNLDSLDYGIEQQPQQGQGQAQVRGQDSDGSAKKRKRNNQTSTNEQPSRSAKRSRKYAGRSSNAPDMSDKPEDVKRSKFLERNRVAASKCRQKKKEWTQNLEERARELQKNNNLLRLNVESLREEIVFLKSEMLKHSSCDCEQIQAFVKSGANDFLATTEDGIVLKREQSPISNMPGSPASPAHSSLRDLDGSPPSASEQPNTSVVSDEFETMLASSIKRDLGEEIIPS